MLEKWLPPASFHSIEETGTAERRNAKNAVVCFLTPQHESARQRFKRPLPRPRCARTRDSAERTFSLSLCRSGVHVRLYDYSFAMHNSLLRLRRHRVQRTLQPSRSARCASFVLSVHIADLPLSEIGAFWGGERGVCKPVYVSSYISICGTAR